jgi:alkyl sulfatase BDS1-like metallo-beta-lactamase superfamily hydrolase
MIVKRRDFVVSWLRVQQRQEAMTMGRRLRGAVIVVGLWGCTAGHPALAQEFAGREKLRSHSQEFRPEVIKVTDGVYAAVGFSLGNSILIEGSDGLIVVDTLTSINDAQAVKAEFDKISRKPVRAIIYTHHHADHVSGATVFAGTDRPEVYAHASLITERAGNLANLGHAGRDGGNQFGGPLIPPSMHINDGVGPQLTNAGGGVGYLAPTQTFSGDETTITVAGVRIQLVHAPAETSDATFVWLPDKKVLLPGDTFYHAFPNLYAIRGTRLRAVDTWIASLEKLIAMQAEHLVPSHTRPISGAAAVRTALTAYHDGIKSVLDQAIAGIKEGLRPDELVERVKLPADLAASPYLQEFYGTVSWSVRAIYTDYVGWFDGNATNLFPLSIRERAAAILDLAGGETPVLTKARAAFDQKNFQLAAELVDYVLAVHAQNRDAITLKAQALIELGERQISANGRNFYLSSAQYLLRDAR